MTKHFRSIAILAGLSTAAYAAPFLAIGDNAELFLTGTLGTRFDDNVLLTKNNESDTVFEFAPGFDLQFGKNSQIKGALSYTETISRYVDNDELDNELSNVGFKSSFDNAKLKLNFDTSFAQLAQNNRDVRSIAGLTRRDVFNIGGGGEVSVSDKTSVGGAARYVNTDYHRAGFVDSKEVTLPVNFYYELTPKVDVSTGFRYRKTYLSGSAIDSEDFYYNVGARGEFTPKLSGSFTVGYTQRDRDDGTDTSTLGLESAFAYAYSEKTRLRASISNDFGVDASGRSQENFTASIGADTSIAPDLTIGGGLTYRKIDYAFAGYKEDYVEANLRVTYIINEYINVFGGYAFRNNDSERSFTSVLDNPNFTNHVFSFGAQVRY